MEHLKQQFWRTLRKALIGKIPYILLGYIVYPFILRTKTRIKYNSGKGGWYNRQLWYMINDDELHRYDVDYDIKKVEAKGIDTSTRWGRFKASYWFNALRNPAYNYSLTHRPIKHNEYDLVDVEIDQIFHKEKKVNPLLWAFWAFKLPDGTITNSGGKISEEDSCIGEGKVWYHPNNNKEILYCRWSWAKKYKCFRVFYVSFSIGAHSDKYDLKFKVQ